MRTHKKHWILTMDSVEYRIFSCESSFKQLALVHKVTHLENKLKDSDLTTDTSGHYMVCGTAAHGAYMPSSDPKEVQLDNFACEIAKELELGRVKHAYDSLIIIALPHMYGLLKRHLDKNILPLITKILEKNAAYLTDSEILKLFL